jgi:hypothetical protein
MDQAEVERLALDGHVVLPVADAEELYSRYGDAESFEALAAAVNAAEGVR